MVTPTVTLDLQVLPPTIHRAALARCPTLLEAHDFSQYPPAVAPGQGACLEVFGPKQDFKGLPGWSFVFTGARATDGSQQWRYKLFHGYVARATGAEMWSFFFEREGARPRRLARW